MAISDFLGSQVAVSSNGRSCSIGTSDVAPSISARASGIPLKALKWLFMKHRWIKSNYTNNETSTAG
jgi:hypothetical protein